MAEQTQQQEKSVFPAGRAPFAVIRNDPNTALLHTKQFHRAEEVSESIAARIAPLDELASVSGKVLEVLEAMRAYAVPWLMANEGFLSAVGTVAAAMERTARPNTPQPELQSAEFAQWLYEFSDGVYTFSDIMRVIVIAAAASVSLSMPPHVKSDAVNQERAGFSILQR